MRFFEKFKSIELSSVQLIVLSSVFFVLFDNYVYFKETYNAFGDIGFCIAAGVLLFIAISTVMGLLIARSILKPFLIVMFLLASAAAYYMAEYKTIINDKMIINIFQTTTGEVYDLLNLKLFVYILLLGVLPSIFVYLIKLKKRSLKEEFKSRLLLIVINLLLIPVLYFAYPKSWVSFFRTHKHIRMYSNPAFFTYSFVRYLQKTYLTKPMKFKHIGLDAKLMPYKKPKLIIFVVGEAARWDHFYLNGYKRNTDPYLSKLKNLIDFPSVRSCGTETAVSVPCMFSIYTRSEFSIKKARYTDNLLDILKRAGVNILWRDNDYGSKHVADRVEYEDFNDKRIKPYCTRFNCKDEVLLYGLKKWLDSLKNDKPVLIILHMKGSHGPDYYKRYPASFEKFKPICKTNQLQNCSRQEVVNAYDNTILYTDKFLYDVVEFLKKNDKKYSTAMFYVSDHGESLGENGIYLHGLPYFMAPEAQKHPACFVWFSNDFGIDVNCAKKLSKNKYSHDNVFYTILGLFGVKTSIYNPKLDIFYPCRRQ